IGNYFFGCRLFVDVTSVSRFTEFHGDEWPEVEKKSARFSDYPAKISDLLFRVLKPGSIVVTQQRARFLDASHIVQPKLFAPVRVLAFRQAKLEEEDNIVLREPFDKP